MKIYTIIPVAILMLVLASCQDTKKNDYSNQSEVKKTGTYTATNHPGKKLMEAKCYLCHNPTADHDNRIAPPMVAVKSHYKTDDITKEEFANAIWHFVEKPTKEKSKMRGAVRRFNLMPYQPFEKADIKQISDYIYDFKIDEPEWFKDHIEEESKGKVQYRNDGKDIVGTDNVDTGNAYAKAESKTHTEIGMEYAFSTKKELGKNLMGTIQKKGTLEAVKFCNKQAYPITDSMAVAQNASIRRVSDKPRNVENQANAKELGIIEKFKKAIANNEKYEPVTTIEDGTVKFYAPITTNSMCLQCHGSPKKDIKTEVLTALTNLYPEDKATGYGVNEIRGIWSITYKQ